MFRHVIVGVDGGPTGRDAVALAKLLVAQDGELALAHVYELTPYRGASGAYGPAQHAESTALLEQAREAAGLDAELVDITASSVGRGLHYLSETREADLLVVGSSAQSLVGRVLVGDITRASLIGAPCAVAVAPLGHAGAAGTIATIGVGYDGTPDCEAALSFARELAAIHGASVSVMTVVEPSTVAGLLRSSPDEEDYAEEMAQARAALAKLEGVNGTVVLGWAGEELTSFGEHVDLLVVGSRGYGPIRRLMFGGVATQLASSAPCPLVVMPRLDGAGVS
jgi:nucleotide-binding universal stress UspA family protein